MRIEKNSSPTIWLGYLSIIFTIKALGGSFHSTITKLGLVTYHGAIIGGLISLLLGGFYFSFIRSRIPTILQSTPSKNRKIILVIVFALLAIAGLGRRAHEIRTHPPDIRQSDMIPMVLAGLESVKQGKSPYFPRVLDEGRVQPGYYIPGLWIVYAPLYFLNIDIRYANLLPTMALYFFLLLFFLKRKEYPTSFETAAGGLLGLVGIHGFSKLLVAHSAAGHTAAFGLTLVLLVAGVFLRLPVLVRVIVPFFLLSREIAVFLFAPYAFYLLLHDRKELLKIIAITIPVGLLLTVPFILASGKEFFAQFLAYQSTNQAPWETMLQYYGWLGLLKRVGWEWLQPGLQLSGSLFAFVYIWRRRDLRPIDALALGGIAFLTFIMFVSTTWGYLFAEPVALALLLFQSTESSPIVKGQTSFRARTEFDVVAPTNRR